MPRNACPHCPRGFINRDLLERHIRFVHPSVPAAAPAPAVAIQPPSRSTGYLAMVSVDPTPTVPPYVPAESGSPPRLRGIHLPGMGRFKVSEVPNLPAVGPSRITPSAERARVTTDQRQEANGAAIATSETWPLRLDPVAHSRPTPAAPLGTRQSQRGSVRFTVVYVAEAQSFSETLHLPNTTPWPSFLNGLAAASTSVAPRYIPGRTDGFRLEDGAWRFSLVDNRDVVEGRWRPLTRILSSLARGPVRQSRPLSATDPSIITTRANSASVGASSDPAEITGRGNAQHSNQHHRWEDKFRAKVLPGTVARWQIRLMDERRGSGRSPAPDRWVPEELGRRPALRFRGEVLCEFRASAEDSTYYIVFLSCSRNRDSPDQQRSWGLRSDDGACRVQIRGGQCQQQVRGRA